MFAHVAGLGLPGIARAGIPIRSKHYRQGKTVRTKPKKGRPIGCHLSSVGAFEQIPAPNSAFRITREGVELIRVPFDVTDIRCVAFENLEAPPRLNVP